MNFEKKIAIAQTYNIAPGVARCHMFYVSLLMSSTAENQPPNNSLTLEHKETPPQLFKHHRTVSLPVGCALFQEPLKIVHERTRSDPLTGDEVDRAIIEKSVTHSSCKAVNGTDVFAKKSQWSRRASTGTRLSKLSPAHSKSTYLTRLLIPHRTLLTLLFLSGVAKWKKNTIW